MDADVQDLLQGIQQAAQLDRENNAAVLDSYLAKSSLVVANVAALRTATSSDAAVLEAALKNPT